MSFNPWLLPDQIGWPRLTCDDLGAFVCVHGMNLLEVGLARWGRVKRLGKLTSLGSNPRSCHFKV